MDSNKIRYGFKNVYYALLKELEGNVTFDTPKPWKGAKSLTLDPEGETNIFYADDIAYNTENINNGYTGSIEMAYLTDAVKEDIFNYVKTTKGTLAEDANKTPNPFALLCEFTGDKHGTRHVFFKVIPSRPNLEANTKEDSIEPDTTSLDLTIVPVAVGDHAWVKDSFNASDADYATFFTTAPALPEEAAE